jgi:sugar phosphate isomerase/epimerase
LSISTESIPKLSISTFTTWHSRCEDDLRVYREAGIDGIGLYEAKLPRGRDQESLEQLVKSGLQPTFCFPEVPSIIPGDTLFSQPRDRVARQARMCEGIARLAQFNPLQVILYAGPPGHNVAEMRTWVIESFREASKVAADVGVRLAIEVLRPSVNGSLVSTVTQALELIDEVGATNIDVLVDTWHFWDDPNAVADISRHADRVVGIQLADRRRDARGMMDRTLPGWGDSDIAGIIRGIRASGFDGWYEIEIFSDDGTFGNDYPDSLWKMPPERLVPEARAAFQHVWQASGTVTA